MLVTVVKKSPEDAFQKNDVVFEGKVIEVGRKEEDWN